MISNIAGYHTKEEWFLGKGSFGSVYRAEKDGKSYAIKIFQTEFLKDEYKKFLDREVDALRKIDHPQVVKFYESGIFSDKGFDYFYIVMDFIEGKKLSTYVGSGDEKLIVGIIESLLVPLEAIHAGGILHRDLKPDNIIIDQKGTPIILDFGLSKIIDYTSIIQTGEFAGTFYFMSPEQIVDSKNIDARSDYFAVGVILYQLLTGLLPFDAPNIPALIEEIQKRYPKAPSDINPNISNKTENVILKLLEKQPYSRYQSTAEIISAFSEEIILRKAKLDLRIRNYVRVLNNEKTVFKKASEAGLISEVLYPANLFASYKPTVKVIQDSRLPFTTDPSTNRLNYPAFSSSPTLQELPYSSGSDTTPLQKKDFHSITQIQEYVKKVIDHQIMYGVNELAAPFFFAKDPSDEWYSINLKLLKESIDYRDKNHSELPLWAGICMNVDGWHDDDIKNEILNKYVKNAPDGFFVYGDPVSNSANLAQVFHYSDFLIKLQKASNVPVITARVNGLGLVLLCLGLSGMSCGISGLDSFQEGLLSDQKEDTYGMDPRYYIPELMSLVTLKKGITTKLKDINKSSISEALKCPCPYCKDILEEEVLISERVKMHFLYRRKEEMDTINSLNEEERLKYIEERLAKALEYKKTLTKEGFKISSDFSHLNTWKSLIEEFKKLGV